jgi:hypothetical protein
MKKMMCVAAFLLCVSVAGALANNGWGLYGAYWDAGDGGEALGPGFKLTVEMVPAMQLDVHVAYFGDFAEEDLDLTVVPLDLGLVLNLPVSDKAKFTLGGGPSYAFVDSDDPDADDEFGGYVGGGLEFKVGEGAALFAELRYNFLDASDVDLNGMAANAGIMVTW